MNYILFFFFILFIGLFPKQVQAQDLGFHTFLASEIIESSGIIYLDGKLITHNDSGGEAALYEIDSLNGSVLRTVYLSNASNVDWEDLCFDQDYIYIGDFGNNGGNRTNLKVYRLSISDYLNTGNDSVSVDTLNFSYSNQVDFTLGSNHTNFDAEAMICLGDSLYIFSKNWLSNTCDIYALSSTPGSYSIAKMDSFDSQGLITGGDYNGSNNTILLCGYGPPIPFIIKLSNFSNGQFSNGLIQRSIVQVPSASSVQIEAVAHKEADRYFLSSETSVFGTGSLFNLDVGSIVSIPNLSELSRVLFPNPTTSDLYIELEAREYLEVYSLSGQFIMRSSESSLNLNKMVSGNYFLLIKNEKKQVIHRQAFRLN
jgi:hypothetical protein